MTLQKFLVDTFKSNIGIDAPKDKLALQRISGKLLRKPRLYFLF